MAEATSNVEFAHHVHEHGEHGGGHGGHPPWLGMIEALVLAIVAVATAWSGYQASRWEALSAADYATQSGYLVMAQEKVTLAGQDHIYDTVTFNGWIAANVAERPKLITFYERRFRPEYRVAFDAWMKLDPRNNPKAPPGPTFMSQYHNANETEARRLSNIGDEYFKKGVETRERADDYVRVTVFLATVLFLTALSQRFTASGPRIAVVAVAGVLLAISAYWLAVLPRT